MLLESIEHTLGIETVSAMLCMCYKEDIKTLITYLVEKHFAAFEGVTYVQTFKALRQRYDQRSSMTPDRSSLLLTDDMLSLKT